MSPCAIVFVAISPNVAIRPQQVERAPEEVRDQVAHCRRHLLRERLEQPLAGTRAVRRPAIVFLPPQERWVADERVEAGFSRVNTSGNSTSQ